MKAQLTPQDITDYALDELDPHDRLYVESILAVDEDARKDVMGMIELAQALEKGFDRLEITELPTLTTEQRANLVQPQFRRWFAIRDIAATILLGIGIYWTAAHADQLGLQNKAKAVADVSVQAAQSVADAMQQPEKTFGTIKTVAAESFSDMDDMMPDMPAICTPPTWVEGAERAEAVVDPVPMN